MKANLVIYHLSIDIPINISTRAAYIHIYFEPDLQIRSALQIVHAPFIHYTQRAHSFTGVETEYIYIP